MTRYNVNVRRDVLVKRGQLGRLARRLATDDSTNLGRRAIGGNNLVNQFCLDAVDNPVAGPGHKVAVLENGNTFLMVSTLFRGVDDLQQTSFWNSELRESYLSSRSQALILLSRRGQQYPKAIFGETVPRKNTSAQYTHP
ncbi:hypothetical protein ABVK25_012415 [Lepraria finkii]|uniref:Uncharacterized protein n=1 Tax=Lepraria finkii TaxID=1340010 RepID=A0ABR4AH82_9LECA